MAFPGTGTIWMNGKLVEWNKATILLATDTFVSQYARTAEDAEREGADAHVVALLFRCLLGETDAANLRVAVRAARDVAVVERLHRVPGNALGDDDALGRGDVRQLRVHTGAERDDVADGRDARHAGAVHLVDLDVAAVHG